MSLKKTVLALGLCAVGLLGCSDDAVGGKADASAERDASAADASTGDAAQLDASSERDASAADAGADAGAPTVVVLQVEPLYAAAPNWNDYVDASDPSKACDPKDAARSVSSCKHGGAQRKLVVPDADSCKGLRARDDGDLLDWSCSVEGDTVTFTSELRAETSAVDFIDVSKPAWRRIGVSVYRDDVEIGASKKAALWENQVLPITEPVTPGVTKLKVRGAVYVSMGATSRSLSVEADNITLVFPDSSTLGAVLGSTQPLLRAAGARFLRMEDAAINVSGEGLGVDLNLVYGVLSRVRIEGSSTASSIGQDIRIQGDATQITDLVSSAAAHDGVLIEGKKLSVDGVHVESAGADGLVLRAKNSSVSRVRVEDCGANGVRARDTSKLLVSDVRVASTLGNGIVLEGVTDSMFRDIVVANSGESGILMQQSPTGSAASENNTFMDVVSTNNVAQGLLLHGDDNRVLLFSGANNGGGGIHVDGKNNLLLHITNVRSNSFGIDVEGPDNTSSNVLSSSNSFGVLIGPNADGAHLQDMFVTDNNFDVYMDGDGTLFGTLRVSNTSSCFSGNDVSSSYSLSSACAQSVSSVVVEQPYTIGDSLPDKLSVNDPLNSDELDETGTLQYGEVQDWLGFSSRYRHWGRDGDGISWLFGGNCKVGSACAIWDLRPLASSSLVDVLGEDVLPEAEDSRYVIEHRWSASTSVQCAKVVGAQWSAPDCSSQVVAYAYEPVDDGLDNDNGLCEFDERCILVRNRGAYPGQGKLERVASTESDERVKLDVYEEKIELYRFAHATP